MSAVLVMKFRTTLPLVGLSSNPRLTGLPTVSLQLYANDGNKNVSLWTRLSDKHSFRQTIPSRRLHLKISYHYLYRIIVRNWMRYISSSLVWYSLVHSNTLKLERLTINTDWIGSSYFYLYNFLLLMIAILLQNVMFSTIDRVITIGLTVFNKMCVCKQI